MSNLPISVCVCVSFTLSLHPSTATRPPAFCLLAFNLGRRSIQLKISQTAAVRMPPQEDASQLPESHPILYFYQKIAS